MQINTLKIKYPKKKRKTIGRGGKKGTYSGRGSKGQKARSGSAINPLFEGGRSSLIDHLKKVRGFKSRNKKFVEVQVSQLGKLFKDKEAVDVKSLKKAGLSPKRLDGRKIKIIGREEIKKGLTIGKDILFSKKSKETIEKAGGKMGV
ncbi:MAG: 50S ribosomal protein L15 [Candidatus Moranbacteria bacterium CG10_big_fil_rev_8_21_14_0_10_35_21]|nr:MAG: 50S ribosomal protein L15 [Candidatus Moranbacteria bacterium CG10_big_fil_rev_8_21_14_0_10_35_21]PJA88786.1 MAG: 50S ribosomal protein L15 [Candidatus Moranbacteria bacterium CG_4_9_14_3_um_filter_36_9]